VTPSARDCAEAIERLSTMVATAAELASNVFVDLLLESDLMGFLSSYLILSITARLASS
jgi:hypothetical protein